MIGFLKTVIRLQEAGIYHLVKFLHPLLLSPNR